MPDSALPSPPTFAPVVPTDEVGHVTRVILTPEQMNEQRAATIRLNAREERSRIFNAFIASVLAHWRPLMVFFAVMLLVVVPPVISYKTEGVVYHLSQFLNVRLIAGTNSTATDRAELARLRSELDAALEAKTALTNERDTAQRELARQQGVATTATEALTTCHRTQIEAHALARCQSDLQGARESARGSLTANQCAIRNATFFNANCPGYRIPVPEPQH